MHYHELDLITETVTKPITGNSQRAGQGDNSHPEQDRMESSRMVLTSPHCTEVCTSQNLELFLDFSSLYLQTTADYREPKP